MMNTEALRPQPPMMTELETVFHFLKISVLYFQEHPFYNFSGGSIFSSNRHVFSRFYFSSNKYSFSSPGMGFPRNEEVLSNPQTHTIFQAGDPFVWIPYYLSSLYSERKRSFPPLLNFGRNEESD